MSSTPYAVTDPARLAALAGHDILDTLPEQGFDDVVRLATRLCATPVALVSLVAADRQWFKARIGFPHCETDLDSSVCKFALVEPDLLVIPDLTADPRTMANPLVTGEPHIRFYAGAPLRTLEGQVLGSLCVIDTVPRPGGLTPEQADDLRALGRQVANLLEMRRAVEGRDQVLERQRTELRQARRIEVLAKASQALLTATDPAAVLDPILSASAGTLGFDRSYIYDIWQDGRHLRLTHSLNASAEVQAFLHRMPYGAPLCGIVAEQGRPLMLTDVQNSEEPAYQTARGIGLNAYAGFPITSRGSLHGVISFASTEVPSFDADALYFFETLARLMSAVYERLDGEKAQRESEVRYRTLFENIDAGFCICEVRFDGDGRAIDHRVLSANPAFAKHTGLTDAVGHWATEIAPGIEQHWHDAYGQVAKTKLPMRFEGEAVPLGRWYDAHLFPAGDDRVAMLIADITERRQAQDALRESAALARENVERVQLALAAGAIIGTWHWDLPSDRFTVDEGFARSFGLDPALGRTGIPLAQIVATVHPEDQAGLAAAIDEVIARGGAYAHQYRVRRADGRYYWIEANGRVDLAPDGTGLTFPGVLIDIEQRRMEAMLIELSERLRKLDSPQAMALAAAETVGHALSLSRAAYGDVDEPGEHIVIARDWLAAGQRSAAGSHTFADYGTFSEALRRGEDVVVANVAEDPLTAGQVDSFRSLDIGSLANLPLMEGGHLKVVFCLHRDRVQAWSAGELAFARRVMDRTEVEIARRSVSGQLRESETRYRTLFESIDVGFCIVEMKFDEAERAVDYRIVEANPAFERQTGAKVAGLWVSEFAPDLERHWFDTYGHVALTGEPAHFENKADVFGRWFDVRALRIGDPADNRVAIFFNDINDRKGMEEALRQLNDTLEQQVHQRTQERDRLWSNTQDIQVIIDGKGIFQAVNPAFTAILGWTSEDAVGRPLFEFVIPDDEGVTDRALQHARVQSLPVVENRYRHKDGGFRWISWVAAPDGDLIYASGRHITAEKEQAEALHNTEEALRQSQKMEAVGQLTGGLAHDFNNLLAGISGSLELMQKRIDQGRFTDVDRYMTVAQGAAKQAAALTHRLLAFSRRQTLDPKPTNVNRLIAGMEELVRRTVGPAIHMEVVGAAGIWPALIDPGQLENALLNLCINARDAMPDGGRITIETANKWLDENGARQHDMAPGQYLSVCVTDTGTGMSPSLIAKVFEPFFTTKPLGQGTGLGLSMVYGFAKQSGGQVRIYSEVGEGSTICLYLPRHYGETDEEGLAQMLDEASRAEQGETVLIVDDEPSVRMLVTEVLEDLGYTAIEAGDSAAGLKVLQSDVRIDLLVTDVGLPGGMNGRQMADAARERRPDLRVLFITGYAENSVITNGHLDHSMQVLTKPFAMDTLASRIKDLITSR
ncbi:MULTISPECIES: GAF domain-containing protein [unclassified Methylobacterium]|uniref:GAF domain-containing protein n=1 Tax=unclassified Methylobacterium TaxID=2615210 RepID=UPI001FEF734D|nr:MULTISPECIES: GAF domain-containing protein [unclassified Methylobacterium]